jgi:hypothetical protein
MLHGRRQIGVGPREIIVTNPASNSTSRRIHPPATKRKRNMKRTTLYVSLTGALFFSAAAFGISSAVDMPRTLMSRADYGVAKQAVVTESRVALSRCRDLEGSAKDVCKAEVRADERVKRAELDARYHGTVAAASDLNVARARARYDVAKAKCGAEVSGEQRSQCMQVARSDKAKAAADAKLASL